MITFRESLEDYFMSNKVIHRYNLTNHYELPGTYVSQSITGRYKKEPFSFRIAEN